MSSTFDGAADPRMRTTTADRERAVDVLKGAFAEGRLTADELEQRTHAALRSVTYADLQRLTADLPVGFAPRLPVRGTPAQIVYPPLRNRGTNGCSVASLVCGLVPVPLAGGVAAIVLGHVGLKQIEQTGEDGHGLAVAGLVLGYLHLAIILAYVVGAMVFAGVLLGHLGH